MNPFRVSWNQNILGGRNIKETIISEGVWYGRFFPMLIRHHALSYLVREAKIQRNTKR
jgi:hypothetical protein